MPFIIVAVSDFEAEFVRWNYEMSATTKKIVFASEDSEMIDGGVNLQFSFWRKACEAFEELRIECLKSEELPIEQDYFYSQCALIIVLAGTSVSQLLGQNFTKDFPHNSPRVPPPKELLIKLLPQEASIAAEYDTFIAKSYDPIRHFGSPKHLYLQELPQRLCNDLKLLQKIWSKICHCGENGDFSHSFDLLNDD